MVKMDQEELQYQVRAEDEDLIIYVKREYIDNKLKAPWSNARGHKAKDLDNWIHGWDDAAIWFGLDGTVADWQKPYTVKDQD